MSDIINSPSHYTEGRTIEPIDVIDDWDLGFYEGQVLKYVARAGHKDDRLQDLRKAKFYLDRLIDNEQYNEPPKITTNMIINGGTGGYALKITDPSFEATKVWFGEDALEETRKLRDLKPESSYKIPDECPCSGCVDYRAWKADGDE